MWVEILHANKVFYTGEGEYRGRTRVYAFPATFLTAGGLILICGLPEPEDEASRDTPARPFGKDDDAEKQRLV